MAKQKLLFESDDGKECSADERFIDTYNLKEKFKECFTEWSEANHTCELLSSYCIDNAQWFYDFFNHICYPESDSV